MDKIKQLTKGKNYHEDKIKGKLENYQNINSKIQDIRKQIADDPTKEEDVIWELKLYIAKLLDFKTTAVSDTKVFKETIKKDMIEFLKKLHKPDYIEHSDLCKQCLQFFLETAFYFELLSEESINQINILSENPFSELLEIKNAFEASINNIQPIAQSTNSINNPVASTSGESEKKALSKTKSATKTSKALTPIDEEVYDVQTQEDAISLSGLSADSESDHAPEMEYDDNLKSLYFSLLNLEQGKSLSDTIIHSDVLNTIAIQSPNLGTMCSSHDFDRRNSAASDDVLIDRFNKEVNDNEFQTPKFDPDTQSDRPDYIAPESVKIDEQQLEKTKLKLVLLAPAIVGGAMAIYKSFSSAKLSSSKDSQKFIGTCYEDGICLD